MEAEMEKMCDVCALNEHCGYLLVPCLHYLCEMCKGTGAFEICPKCDTKDVKLFEEGKLTEPGEYEFSSKLLAGFNSDIDKNRKRRAELIGEMQNLERQYQDDVSRINRLISFVDYKAEMNESKIRMIKRFCSGNLKPNETLSGLKGDVVFKSGPPYKNLDPKHTSLNLFSSGCPVSVTSDSKGRILVCDRSRNKVYMFDTDGVLEQSFGKDGILSDGFEEPTGFTVDKNDNIYVSDSLNSRVCVYSPNGERRLVFGSKGNKYGQFHELRELVVTEAFEILVVDRGNSRIQVFNRYGTFVRKFGKEGKEKGKLSHPIGIALNSRHEILVVEMGNNRIQVFDYGGTHIRFIGEGQLMSPSRLCVDSEDNVYVGSLDIGVPLKVFDKEGKLLSSFVMIDDGTTITGISINKLTGALMIADAVRSRVTVF